MTDFINHRSFIDLERALQPLAANVEVRALHWIHTPEGDQGNEWCFDCGRYKVRNLRRRDRKNREDYGLDGGWRTEEEGFKFCEGCGAHLDAHVLPYGVYSELDYYREYGFSTDATLDAYYISEMLNSLCCTDGSQEQEQAALELWLMAQEFRRKVN